MNDDRLGVVSAESNQLHNEALRDARTRESRDAVDTFLGTGARSAGSEPSIFLALPEGVLAPNSVAPEGESAARDIACHLYQRVAAASDRFNFGTRAVHPAFTVTTAEEDAVQGSDSVPVVCTDGRLGRDTTSLWLTPCTFW